MQINLNIKITQKEQKRLEDYIQKKVIDETYQRLLRAKEHLQRVLPGEIETKFITSPEIHELIFGTLRYDLGLKAEEAVRISEEIPDIIIRHIVVDLNRSRNSISIIVRLDKKMYDDLFALKDASFLQTYTTKTPTVIPWLEWMLTRGDEIVVFDYRVHYVPSHRSHVSRSGGAIMVQRGGFRIPPQFSGTLDNNFVTRALSHLDDFIFQTIERFL